MKQHNGFTLIELMITVAIVAILAAIALPSYQDYVRRGQLTEAFNNLSDVRVRMEQFFQDNRFYPPDGCVTGTPTATQIQVPIGKYFTTTCPTLTATTYTVQAAGSSGLTSGFTYTIDQTNLRTTAAVPAGWTAPSPNTCWVIKKGGVC